LSTPIRQKPADRLRAFLQSRALSQTDFAEALGLSRQFISQVLAGTKQLSRESAEKINAVYGLSLDWLLLGEGDIYGGTTTTQPAHTVTVAGSSAMPPRGARPVMICPRCFSSLEGGEDRCPACQLKLNWPEF